MPMENFAKNCDFFPQNQDELIKLATMQHISSTVLLITIGTSLRLEL